MLFILVLNLTGRRRFIWVEFLVSTFYEVSCKTVKTVKSLQDIYLVLCTLERSIDTVSLKLFQSKTGLYLQFK